jgi:NNP family nitrate/nitrite transporter-like MFS transporter
VELTIHNLAAVYFVDHFSLNLTTAGIYVGCFGLLALFARALGGIASDRLAHRNGLSARVTLLFALILAEGLGLMAFSQMPTPGAALIALLIFGLFTHMACGSTYSLVPFINRNALGGVAGIIGAGGNVGAVAAGFLVKGSSTTEQALFILGVIVAVTAVCALAVRFSHDQKAEERRLYADALNARALQDAPPASAEAVVS